MAKIPGYCDACLKPFESPLETISSTMFLNVPVECPYCGGFARTGFADSQQNVLKSEDAGKLTGRQIKELVTILQNSLKEQASAEEIKEAIEARVPAAVVLNKFFAEYPGPLALATLILAILQIAVPMLTSPSGSIDVEKLADAILKAQKAAESLKPDSDNSNERNSKQQHIRVAKKAAPSTSKKSKKRSNPNGHK